MTSRLVLLFSFVLLCYASKAQRISKDSLQHLVKEYDDLLATEDYDYSQRTITEVDGQYRIEEKFKDGKKAGVINTSAFPLGEKLVGIQSESLFYPNGNRKKSMKVISGREVYTEYFNNGSVFVQYLYNLGEKVLLKLYDTRGNVLVNDGMGQAIYITVDSPELRFIETGEVKDGLPVGEWEGYYTSGNLYYRESYLKVLLMTKKEMNLNTTKRQNQLLLVKGKRMLYELF
jgi:antitoxin component YwqK of YwqJK toxin-antitoxin module